MPPIAPLASVWEHVCVRVVLRCDVREPVRADVARSGCAPREVSRVLWGSREVWHGDMSTECGRAAAVESVARRLKSTDGLDLCTY